MTANYIDMLNRNFRLDRERAALVIVDLQYASGSREIGLGAWLKEQGRLADASYRFDRIDQLVVPNSRRLLDAFRRDGLRVMYLTIGAELPDYSDVPQHMRAFFAACGNHAGAREHEIIDELKPIDGEPVLNKTTQGAFASSRIDQLLKALGVTQLVMVGVSTNNCVETTAREASDRGYEVVLVGDATGTCSDMMQNAALTGFSRLWGRVADTADVLGELNLSDPRSVEPVRRSA